MCGITGFLTSSNSSSEPEMHACVTRMSRMLKHRGPDHSGAWANAPSGVALGFRRLSILDLSPTGHQPMLSESRRYIIVFNGEVYNFKQIRSELETRGARFKGSSDTEVILAAIEAWGIKDALRRFSGMFAFALWDQDKRTLTLARDRMGIKPLYYGLLNGTFLFGSELKALRAHPAFQSEIDRSALTLYMRHNYIPAPYSIYQGVQKLPPGSMLTIQLDSLPTIPAPEHYWHLDDSIRTGLMDPLQGSDEEITTIFTKHLLKSVGERMVSDVPLGAFLSGGIDSSAIVALMQAQSNRPIQTFTIGFYETGFNEAKYASQVAKHLGTDHTELFITSDEARAVIPLLPQLFDEPFADSSQIPTFLVSQLARKHVTVSLSGDGGDELFGGYNRYFWTQRIWRTIGWIPSSLRRLAATSLARVSPNTWSHLLTPFRLPNPANKMHTLTEIFSAPNPEAIYVNLVSHWKNPAQVVVGGVEPRTQVTDPTQWMQNIPLPQKMMALDMATYLPNDILTKVDRASMAVGLEARAPFLDNYETVDLAWRLPLHQKIRGGIGKWILRKMLYQYVPKSMFERPKMGFGVPIDSWLRGPLRPWAEDLLSASRLLREGFFHPGPIRQKWEEHIAGQHNWQYYLWDVLMFQAWWQSQE